MAAVTELIRTEQDGSLSFGNHTLSEKSKLEDYPCAGNLYKVKTFNELTKLERDGMFVYESEPGTSVNSFRVTADGVSFKVSGDKDAMITIGLNEDTEYEVFIGEKSIGKIKTNLGGKLSVSVPLEGEDETEIKVVK